MPRYRFLFLLLLVCNATIAAPFESLAQDSPAPIETFHRNETVVCTAQDTFVLAVHGGAVWGRHPHSRKVEMLKALLPALGNRLSRGATAIDVVQAAVHAMEDSGVFNAGKGAIANQAAAIEMDGSIMDGRSLAAGAVAGVSRLRNPIDAARIVMEQSGNVLLIGDGAESFALENGAAEAPTDYFLHGLGKIGDIPLPDDLKIAPPDAELPADLAELSGTWAGVWAGAVNHLLIIESIDQDGGTLVFAQGENEDYGLSEGIWERRPFRFEDNAIVFERLNDDQHLPPRHIATVTYRLVDRDTLAADYVMTGGGSMSGTLRKISNPGHENQGGTVGAVALDRCGDLAAALSTGGFGSKRPGRVGDSPIVGAGLYAKNGVAAVAATGQGEFFQRGVLAYQVVALMELAGLSLPEASDQVIDGTLNAMGGKGGLIGVDKDGHIAEPYNTDGMVRGVVGSDVSMRVMVY